MIGRLLCRLGRHDCWYVCDHFSISTVLASTDTPCDSGHIECSRCERVFA